MGQSESETLWSWSRVSEGKKTDWFGVILGAMVFLAGIGMLVVTFLQARDMFSVPPSQMIKDQSGDVTQIGVNFGTVLLRIGLLLVMSLVGSVISSKGIRMYLAARAGIAVQGEKA